MELLISDTAGGLRQTTNGTHIERRPSRADSSLCGAPKHGHRCEQHGHLYSKSPLRAECKVGVAPLAATKAPFQRVITNYSKAPDQSDKSTKRTKAQPRELQTWLTTTPRAIYC